MSKTCHETESTPTVNWNVLYQKTKKPQIIVHRTQVNVVMDKNTNSQGRKAEPILERENGNEILQKNVPCRTSQNQQTGGRIRLYSESQVCSQIGSGEDSEFLEGVSQASEGDGGPFRGRSQSAPAALWAAKKYGRQLRRMSDEFDTWLDKGEAKRGLSSEAARQRQMSRGWFSFLWSSKEAEGRE